MICQIGHVTARRKGADDRGETIYPTPGRGKGRFPDRREQREEQVQDQPRQRADNEGQTKDGPTTAAAPADAANHSGHNGAGRDSQSSPRSGNQERNRRRRHRGRQQSPSPVPLADNRQRNGSEQFRRPRPGQQRPDRHERNGHGTQNG